MSWNNSKETRRFKAEQERNKKYYEENGMTDEQIQTMFDYDTHVIFTKIFETTKRGRTFVRPRCYLLFGFTSCLIGVKHYAAAFALIFSITLLIPNQIEISVNTSTILPLSVNGGS